MNGCNYGVIMVAISVLGMVVIVKIFLVLIKRTTSESHWISSLLLREIKKWLQGDTIFIMDYNSNFVSSQISSFVRDSIVSYIFACNLLFALITHLRVILSTHVSTWIDYRTEAIAASCALTHARVMHVRKTHANEEKEKEGEIEEKLEELEI